MLLEHSGRHDALSFGERPDLLSPSDIRFAQDAANALFSPPPVAQEKTANGHRPCLPRNDTDYLRGVEVAVPNPTSESPSGLPDAVRMRQCAQALVVVRALRIDGLNSCRVLIRLLSRLIAVRRLATPGDKPCPERVNRQMRT